ncbi:MAG: AmpG family muropeptide MFS transporter [Alphaproteobacteria bacterium]|nr:AmpG family muropeptide MFS transporter [Alphaproteobacteria bacterium]
MLAILCLGFSSGLPLLLVFSTMSLWLKDEGVSKTAIGLFSLVRTPYSFKFLWSPVIDIIRIPVLTQILGRRRSWALVSQLCLMLAIFVLSLSQPSVTPELTALFAVFVAFCSANQDIVIDAMRIEMLDDDEQGAGAGMATLGYRIGMLLAGAGATYMATYFSWESVYQMVSLAVLVGMITVLCIKEPANSKVAETVYKKKTGSWFERSGVYLRQGVVEPFADFMKRKEWLLILAFIMLYKLCDAYMGVMALPFYREMGFSNAEIATISKLYGVGATIFGTIIGGIMVSRYGVMKSLLVCGVLQALSNLVFAYQAHVGYSTGMLMVTISVENVTGGMGTAAFVAYMSGLCNVAYTATQYALLSSFMVFARDLFSSTSGWLADQVSWVEFFVITTFAAIPGLVLLIIMMYKFPVVQMSFGGDGNRDEKGEAAI